MLWTPTTHLWLQRVYPLFHVLVGLLSTPASGKHGKTLQILQGYESAKGSCANDGFAALHAIIKVYEVRPAPRGRRLRVENELRIAK